MATEYLFSNNATTTLAQSVSPTATVLNVASGTGGMFPSPASGQAFAVTLVDAATGLTNEICYCTSRSGDQLTVSRGQEGTNATTWAAGDTCANYITSGVMASWLQESDLNGYATQAWSSNQFVGRGASAYDFTPLQLGVNKTSGQIWTSYTDGSGNIKYAFSQVAGDYATNADLSAESSSRSSADTNLQNQVNNRVLKTGDTMTGALTIEGNTGGFIAQYNPGSPASGSFINYPGFTSIAEGRGGKFFCQLQEQVGTNFRALMALQFADGSWRYVKWGENERINDSQYGDVAYASDLGNYVPASTYASDFGTSDSRVLNFPYGHKIQKFTFQGTPNAGQLWVPFPEAFSDVPVVMISINNETGGVFSQRYVCIKNTSDGQNAPYITSSGFLSYSAWGNSSGTFASTTPVTLQVTAIGSK